MAAEDFQVPMIGSPLVASRPEPVRAARVPQAVKLAIVDMVELGDDFVSAGKRHGVTAQMMRRWLGRAEAISFLRKERSRFRQSVCAQNEFVLAEIRDDRDGNQMARVHAVRALEQLADGEVARPSSAPSPGITLVIHQPAPAPIDITPRPSPIIDACD
jgi:hypothetical protein